MKQKILKVLKYLLNIILTALASAGIALLQNYLQSKGASADVTLSVNDTGILGGVIASLRIAIQNIRNVNIC